MQPRSSEGRLGQAQTASAWDVLSRCWFVMKEAGSRRPYSCSFMLLAVLLTGLAPIVRLWVLKELTDATIDYIRDPASARAMHDLGLYLFCQVAVEVFSAALRTMYRLRLMNVSTNLTLDMQDSLAVSFARREFEFFERSENQDILQRAQGQAVGAAVGLLQSLVDLAGVFVSIVGATFALMCFNGWLGLLACGCAGLGYGLYSRISRYEYDVTASRSNRVRRCGYLWSLLTVRFLVRDTLIYGLADRFRDQWHNGSAATVREDLQIASKRSIADLTVTTAASLASFVAYGAIAILTARAGGTFGQVTLNIGLFARTQQETQRLSTILGALYRHSIFIGDFLELATGHDPRTGANRRSFQGPIRSVEFRNVSFRYPGAQTPVLRNVSFSVRAGECLFLAGRSGSGKTTLIKLLLRLYEPSEGAILFNGRDIHEFSPASLQRECAALMQDYMRYPFSVRENVLLGDCAREARTEEIERSLRDAEFGDVISKMPQGTDTVLGRMLGGDIDLSGGEWQRLALARMLYRGASLMILDEPTSSLDMETEAHVLTVFRRTLEDRIGILISHRATAAAFATRTISIEEGRVTDDIEHEDHAPRVLFAADAP